MTQAVDLVLDGSVAIAWFFDDECNPYADTIAARLDTIRPFVPSLWRLEVANTLLMGERRKRSDRVNTEKWTSFLGSLPIVIDAETDFHAFDATLELARMHDLSAYDASYLELALRRSFPIATLDKKLRDAAQTSGVTISSP